MTVDDEEQPLEDWGSSRLVNMGGGGGWAEAIGLAVVGLLFAVVVGVLLGSVAAELLS